MSRIKVKVPLPSHLHAYLRFHLKDEARINFNSVLGEFFHGLISPSLTPVKDELYGFNDYLELLLPARDEHGNSYDVRYQHHAIDLRALKRLHAMLETLLRNELFARLDLICERGESQRKGGKMTEEIEKFIAKYGNDRHLWQIDTLRKAYYRYRSDRKPQLNRLL